MSKFPMPSGLMTSREVAGHFNCNVSTVWRWLRQGILPKPVKIAGSTRWRREEIEAMTAGETAA
ncbi:helix-turn-helix transcriptional regulator [Tabrizicola sp.]|uniref:helix-turn-helix transcriptional regulator n=1 Tax=Tabrizicola sp. TaxID=2005166 RepID=UPI0035ADAD13